MNDMDWEESTAHRFWSEIAPTSHLLQVYDNDEIFLETLTGFVTAGINKKESVIIIATDTHLKALQQKITSLGVQVDDLIKDQLYIPLDAETVLSKFMVNGWPDETLFNNTVSAVLAMAKDKTRVRAFGEMVAVLWKQGHTGATILLEHFWNKFCEKESFPLFCSYPACGFTDDKNGSLQNICRHHTTLIAGFEKPEQKIFYKKTA